MSDDITTPPASPAPVAATDGGAAGAPFISEDMVKLALRRVKDPELNLNILDLGLVYGIEIDGTTVKVDMSLTSPACPSGAELVHDATKQVSAIPGVTDAQVNIVWSPPWTPDRIEPRVRTYLGF
ncbi:MAG: metal-sulfur cluster assembly factor [Gemmatimonadaceae bacterium]